MVTELTAHRKTELVQAPNEIDKIEATNAKNRVKGVLAGTQAALITRNVTGPASRHRVQPSLMHTFLGNLQKIKQVLEVTNELQ